MDAGGSFPQRGYLTRPQLAVSDRPSGCNLCDLEDAGSVDVVFLGEATETGSVSKIREPLTFFFKIGRVSVFIYTHCISLGSLHVRRARAMSRVSQHWFFQAHAMRHTVGFPPAGFWDSKPAIRYHSPDFSH